MKTIVKYILKKSGYTISKIVYPKPFIKETPLQLPLVVDGFSFDMISPSIKYAPWLNDDIFMKVCDEVKDHTLVDFYRCFELWEAVETVNRLNPAASFLEVGVWRGGTAAVIAQKLNLLGSNNLVI